MLRNISEMMDQTPTAEERRVWWPKSVGSPEIVGFLEELWADLYSSASGTRTGDVAHKTYPRRQSSAGEGASDGRFHETPNQLSVSERFH